MTFPCWLGCCRLCSNIGRTTARRTQQGRTSSPPPAVHLLPSPDSTELRRGSRRWESSSAMASMLPSSVVGTVLRLLLLLAGGTTRMALHSATALSSSASSASSASIKKQSVLSIPLIPHHVQRRRRLQQLHGPLGLPPLSSSSSSGASDEDLSYRKRRDRHGRHLSPRQWQNRLLHDRQLKDNITNSTDTSKMQVAHLFQGYGTHYADLWCGQPSAQRQTVIVDTGSGVTAFPCVGCDPEECGVPKYHLDALFDPSGSTSYHKLDCTECKRGSCSGGSDCKIGMSYQEGSSWNAFEVRDHCYVGGLHATALSQDGSPTKDDLDPFHAPAFAFPLTFGCQTRLTGLFKTQLADGIMGMDHAEVAFWNQMSSSLGLANQFGLCFSRSPTASRDGTNAGAMTLGGTDLRLHDTDMVYTPVSAGSGFYDVTIRQIYLRQGGGESAAYDANAKVTPILTSPTSAIVDSGTTDTYFSRSMRTAFDAAFKEMTGGATYTHGDVTMSEEELHNRPTILMQLAGDAGLNQAVAESKGGTVVGLAGDLDPDHPYDVLLAIPASHYYEYDEDQDTYTARFYVEESGGNVIGANSMMGHEVFFDVDNDRIGWSESTCDYPALVEPFLESGQLAPAPTPASREDTPDPDPEPSGGGDGDGDGGDGGGDGGEDHGDTTHGDNDGGDTSPTGDGGSAPEKKPEPGSGSDQDDAPEDDGGGSTHMEDKPDGDAPKPSTAVCSARCKFGMVTGVLLAGVLVVVVLVRRGAAEGGGLLRRKPRKRAYRMAHTELELGELPSIDSDEFDDGIQYRDHPTSRSHDEQETGILS